MKPFKLILLAGGAVACAASAQAADLPTKKGAPAPEALNCFASFWSWLDASAKDCPLSYWGVTFYGQIDVGAGYETNASRFNGDARQGVGELIQKMGHGAEWQWTPNALSMSNAGVKWKEKIVSDWYFVGDVNFGFDPYSLRFSDGPRSLADNNTIPLFQQTLASDSSRTYGVINGRALAGVSNATFGTLTYGRQTDFSSDNISIYDPMGSSNAFSLIGWSTTLGGGLGDTETATFTNSIRYTYADHNVRAGVISQVGGYDTGNNAQYAIEGDVGFDWQGLSFDGVYLYAKDAVSLANYGAAVGPNPATNPVTSDTLKATIQDIHSIQLVAKYNWKQLTVYGGWERAELGNPDDLPIGAAFRDFNGGFSGAYGTTIQGNAFPIAKIINVGWVGAKYAVLPNLDLVGAYYGVWQNNYLGSTQTFAGASASCAPNTSKSGGIQEVGTNSAKCAGTEDAVSGMIDWRPVKRVDVYAGVMYSNITGGLASGFLANNNTAGTAGLRISF
jgi:predicted porin